MSSQSQIIETLITAVKSQVDLGAETPSVELQATSSPPSASGVVTRGMSLTSFILDWFHSLTYVL